MGLTCLCLFHCYLYTTVLGFDMAHSDPVASTVVVVQLFDVSLVYFDAKVADPRIGFG